MTNFTFLPYSKDSINSYCSPRDGETRLGETVNSEINSNTRFAILGICEDIGPQSNLGNPGAKNSFHSFLSKFLNMQSNRFLNGDEIALIGEIQQLTSFESVEQGRTLVNELDELVSQVLQGIFDKGIIPIIIGGGHNNAYPIIKAHYLAKHESLDIINVDPHSDCRKNEGRHSGNPFSFGIEQGYINDYSVLGLHKAYNSAYLLKYLEEHACFFSFYEDYIMNPVQFETDIQRVIIRSDQAIGIELDMDAIQLMPSSAITPSGISLEQARKYILKMASSKRPTAYLHLPEGAPITKQEELIVGKSLAYLVHDFIATNK